MITLSGIPELKEELELEELERLGLTPVATITADGRLEKFRPIAKPSFQCRGQQGE